MTNFRKKHKGYFCGKLRKRKVKKQKPFQKLLEQISQCPQCSQRRQSQSSRGNVYGETDQEPGNRHISGNTGTIPKHPLLQEGIFGRKRLRTILKQ